MTIYEKLQGARTEEDVKDIYIKALGLKAYQKNLIDIQTDQIWFEAKLKRTNTMRMFAQLLCYVKKAVEDGEAIPPFLCVIDKEHAALMETKSAMGAINDKSLDWPSNKQLSASAVSHDFVKQVESYIGTHSVSYEIESNEVDFLDAVKNVLKNEKIVRREITPNNLRHVFDNWIDAVGVEIDGVSEEDYALLFFADIMNDGKAAVQKDLPARLLFDGEDPVFELRGKTFRLNSKRGYQSFWNIFHRPPAEEHRKDLLERRDSLLPLDAQRFKGAYYTPLKVVDKAYEYLDEIFGKNWQKDYVVWDMCCGVGNLEVKHNRPRNVFMSTLDQADVEIIRATRTCRGAEVFQYDYLNDDITDDGEIDYSLTEKVPASLRKALADPKQKVLVLMNPPYAEATNLGNIAQGKDAKNKSGVASKTRVKEVMMDEFGKAKNELSGQFLVRIMKEIPNATVAMFCTLKYVSSGGFEEFRSKWNAEYKGGFIFPSTLFDGLKGKFPIGFLTWKTSSDKMTFPEEIEPDVLDADLECIGKKKFYSTTKGELLNKWVNRLSATPGLEVVPLKNAVSVATCASPISSWNKDAIGYLNCVSNDMQNAAIKTTLYSSVCGTGHGFYVTKENFTKAAVVFAARRIVSPTWINNRDQFYQPTSDLPTEMVSDCVVWTIFNGSNLTASTSGLEWNGGGGT